MQPLGDFLSDAAKASPFTSRPQQEEMIKNAKQRELAGSDQVLEGQS